MTISRYDIGKKLKDIFVSRLGINFDGMDSSVLDYHMMGQRLKLASRDLLYIFVDIEKEFQIKISESDVIEGKFTTFNNMVDCIEKQIYNQNEILVIMDRRNL